MHSDNALDLTQINFTGDSAASIGKLQEILESLSQEDRFSTLNLARCVFSDHKGIRDVFLQILGYLLATQPLQLISFQHADFSRCDDRFFELLASEFQTFEQKLSIDIRGSTFNPDRARMHLESLREIHRNQHITFIFTYDAPEWDPKLIYTTITPQTRLAMSSDWSMRKITFPPYAETSTAVSSQSISTDFIDATGYVTVSSAGAPDAKPRPTLSLPCAAAAGVAEPPPLSPATHRKGSRVTDDIAIHI